MSCPPPSPEVCPQVCPPPPPPQPCYVKPVMRCLHHAQTVRTLWEAMLLCAVGGTCVYFFIGVPRKAAYRDFYARAEFEDWGDEMARKGLFQSVPKEGLKDNQQMKSK
ncbi:uncharacterized protein LOC128199297 [Bicyclus anynana]|uniref:Uncharacterized protein LOC128199297 n=1 Tax=Bicyclus anynana TaxID=110368 RepID=A0ABM3LYR2_BICAN|nr:uncharacterized protein LOC128199297 [Bicyclus anynana]